MTDDNFAPRMWEYIAELEKDFVISRSHITLGNLYRDFGKERVLEWTEAYFSKVRGIYVEHTADRVSAED